jgi:MFS family permease
MRDYPHNLAVAHARRGARRERFGALHRGVASWISVTNQAPPSPATRLAGITLAPGYRPAHAVSYLYGAFVTIGLFAFVAYFQPFLLNENLRLPENVQGRTLAGLNFANELLALLLVAPFGALADKIGRRAVYAFGFLWMGGGFLLYPLAGTVTQLLGCALFFSVGVAAVGTMLGTVLADTPAEDSRGRMVGIAGLFQGLGAAAFVLILGHLPRRLVEGGMEVRAAGALTLWIAAALCVISAAVVFAGLKRGTPSIRAPALPVSRVLADGMAAARLNPRIWFAYLLQFGSFGDRVVLGTFLALRLQQAWLEQGVSAAGAVDRARIPFVAAMVAGLVTALVVGVLLDKLDRVKIGVAAMALAAVAYLACGFIADPAHSTLLLAVAVLLGAGQIAAIIAGQTLLGQEAPRDVRGAVFGLAGICASAGILFTNGVGGWLYDFVSRGGPFFLLAGVNFVVFLFGLWLVRKRAGSPG